MIISTNTYPIEPTSFASLLHNCASIDAFCAHILDKRNYGLILAYTKIGLQQHRGSSTVRMYLRKRSCYVAATGSDL